MRNQDRKLWVFIEKDPHMPLTPAICETRAMVQKDASKFYIKIIRN